MRAEWITMTKVGDVRLVQPLAGRDGPSRGHFLAISPWTEPTSSETYSKNLKVVLATFLSAMAAIAAIQSSGRERPLPSTQPSPHTVAHCARLRICVSNPRWTGEVVRLATIA